MLGLSKQSGLFVVPMPMKALFYRCLSGLFLRIRGKKKSMEKKMHNKNSRKYPLAWFYMIKAGAPLSSFYFYCCDKSLLC